MSGDIFSEWTRKAVNAQSAANKILADEGNSRARVAFLEDVGGKLSGSPIDVQEYFEEAILCLKNGLVRSSIVVAWSGFFSIFCEKLLSGNEMEIRKCREKWKFSDINTFKEGYPEAQIIEVAKEVSFISNPRRRMLDGWLSQRNQCAHPTIYRPSLNVGIGYLDTMVSETLVIL